MPCRRYAYSTGGTRSTQRPMPGKPQNLRVASMLLSDLKTVTRSRNCLPGDVMLCSNLPRSGPPLSGSVPICCSSYTRILKKPTGSPRTSEPYSTGDLQKTVPDSTSPAGTTAWQNPASSHSTPLQPHFTNIQTKSSTSTTTARPTPPQNQSIQKSRRSGLNSTA